MEPTRLGFEQQPSQGWDRIRPQLDELHKSGIVVAQRLQSTDRILDANLKSFKLSPLGLQWRQHEGLLASAQESLASTACSANPTAGYVTLPRSITWRDDFLRRLPAPIEDRIRDEVKGSTVHQVRWRERKSFPLSDQIQLDSD
jgi:hypothetical protein